MDLNMQLALSFHQEHELPKAAYGSICAPVLYCL